MAHTFRQVDWVASCFFLLLLLEEPPPSPANGAGSSFYYFVGFFFLLKGQRVLRNFVYWVGETITNTRSSYSQKCAVPDWLWDVFCLLTDWDFVPTWQKQTAKEQNRKESTKWKKLCVVVCFWGLTVEARAADCRLIVERESFASFYIRNILWENSPIHGRCCIHGSSLLWCRVPTPPISRQSHSRNSRKKRNTHTKQKQKKND